jgi:hypothetical protein
VLFASQVFVWLIEIRLSNGHSIVLYGEINAKALALVIALLVRR